MSTLEATVSMLEAMPEEARRQVFEFTQRLFTAPKPASPFTSLSAGSILADLDESRRQIAEGQGTDMADALDGIYHQLQDYENLFI